MTHLLDAVMAETEAARETPRVMPRSVHARLCGALAGATLAESWASRMTSGCAYRTERRLFDFQLERCRSVDKWSYRPTGLLVGR